MQDRLNEAYGDQSVYETVERQAVASAVELMRTDTTLQAVLRVLACQRYLLARQQVPAWFVLHNPEIPDLLTTHAATVAERVARFGLPRQVDLYEAIGYVGQLSLTANDTTPLDQAIQNQIDYRRDHRQASECKTPVSNEPLFATYLDRIMQLCAPPTTSTTIRADLEGKFMITARLVREDPNRRDVTVYHMSPIDHNAVLARCERSFEVLLEAGRSGMHAKVIEALVDVFFWLSLAMLYVRGSSAITRWLALAALTCFGIDHHRPPPTAHPDLDAILATSRAEFARQLVTHFALKPEHSGI